MPSSASHGFDVGRLEAYLREHIAGLTGPLHLERFPGGQSNPTYKVTSPGGCYAMRCKPAPKARLLPSAHAIEREYRVQAALAASGVPVPRMYCLCEDESVIGRAFYVMELVAGRIFWEPGLTDSSAHERTAIYAEMNRVIAALHCVDYAALGLADYGKPGNYFARQIDRWSRQYRASEMQRIEAMERLIEWLPTHLPPESEPPTRIVHGDFRLDNLIFHPSEPRVLAVIDWELSTLGHPLADFAYHIMSWYVPPEHSHGMAGLDLATLGIPTAQEHWSSYLRRTGLQIAADPRFYLVYNLFRSAGILQGIAKRAQEGTASSTEAAEVAKSARPMAELAWQIARELSA
jgi:aminoglycoside phosphotransferase (APT) family kinase protein